MKKAALLALIATVVAACNPTPRQSKENTVQGPTVSAFARTPLAKATATLTLDTSKGRPGQVAIADVLSYSGGRPSITAPKGWTLIRDNSGLSTRQVLYWHIIEPNEASPPAWTFGEEVDTEGAIVLLDNVEVTDPVDTSSGNAGGPMAAKSLTTTSDGDLILAFFATDYSGPDIAPELPADVNVIVKPDTDSRQYWVLGVYQSNKGDTQDIVSSSSKGFSWVAAQVAIRRSTTPAKS